MKKGQDTGIMPECYVDTNLTETLTGVVCNHQKGCNNVVKQMKEKRADRFALGIIDKDKRTVGYVSEFEKIAENESLEVLKHSDRPHYIIYVIPAVEGFILSAAEEQGIKLADFGLPSDLESLRRESKQQDSKNDPRFRALFNALQDARSFELMRSVITYLRENPYSVDVEVVKGLFEDGR